MACFCNTSNFVWYVLVADDGLRSVGADALPPSKSACSILPTVRHLRAGTLRTLYAARVMLRRFLFLLSLLSPPSFAGFLGYLTSPLERELLGTGTSALRPPSLPYR
jgi:MFS superfamily sulfate permease-like transporter